MSKHLDSCANCGVEEKESELELWSCPTCHLVYYCSDKCLAEHRPDHEHECKKREAELKDEKYNELLFKQPESSHLGDCPICFLPMPLDHRFSVLSFCCFKTICRGCCEANKKREDEEKLRQRCPFCRELLPTIRSKAEALERAKNRAKNHPNAMCQLGKHYRDEGDDDSAFECFSKAAESGNIESHNELAISYCLGCGVEKNKSKEVFHLEQASIGGDPVARCTLGNLEWIHGQDERAVTHWIIAAHQGDDESLEQLKMSYIRGLVAKDDYAAALRGHQAAVDATKSPQREEAAALILNYCEKQS